MQALTRASSRPRETSATRRVLVATFAMTVLIVAVGLRFTYVDQIPRFTDETDIISRSLDIVREGTRPLTDTEAYIGSGFNYLLAATFAVVGVGPVVARYLVAVLGVLTVVATLALAAEISAMVRRSPERRNWDETDIMVGLLAAAALAVSPVHILVNSRIGWAHSTTPLFTTIALALLVRAVRREQASLLPLAGFFTGFALQSHPSVVALLPGMLAWVIWRGRQALSERRWVLLAVVFGAVGCANLLLYNLTTEFDSVRAALDKSDAYDAERGGEAGYAAALWFEGLGLARVLAGTIGTQRGDEPPVSLEIAAWGVLACVLAAYAFRRGATVILLVVVPFLLILPLLNAKFEPLFNGRYVMPIVPLIATAWAIAVADVYAWLQRARSGAGLLVVAVVSVTLALPVWHLVAYEQVALASSSNQAHISLVARIRDARDAGEVVLLDTALGGERVASGRRGVSVVEYYLRMVPDPPTVIVGELDELATYLEAHETNALLVLLPNARRRLGTQFDMTTVGTAPRSQAQSINNAGLYRARPRE